MVSSMSHEATDRRCPPSANCVLQRKLFESILTMGRKNRTSRQPPLPRASEEINSEDDESIDDDEAFNSEDERKYGSFFNKAKGNAENSDDEDDESIESSEDDDDSMSGSDNEEDDSGGSENGDNGRYMMDLLDRLGEQSGQTQNDKSMDNNSNSRALAASTKESEFSSSVIRPAGLTMDAMMDSIKDTKGFGTLAKSIKHVTQDKAASARLPQIVRDRLERKTHYKDQANKISEWTHVVQENRQAESLDFRPQEKLTVTKDTMVEKFVPRSDFEKELASALEEAGQKDEAAILKAEEQALTDDLGSNKISMEEFKKRRGQLAKMRALMFYHEQKRHHINKIKSKKYRRVRKRQRERLKEAEAEENPEILQELKEKEEIERIEERMTLAHKNTSKWAKRVLKRGKNVDVDTRRALSAQLKRGDDLLKKMKATSDDEDDSDEDLAESARKVLEETEDDTNDDAVQGKGLFKLAFMQKGVERARQKAKEEARQLLMELEADEKAGEESFSSDEDDSEEAPSKKKLKAASKKEMKNILGEGQMVASGLTFGNATTLSVSGSIDIDPQKEASMTTVSEHKAVLSGAVGSEVSKPDGSNESSGRRKKREKVVSVGEKMPEQNAHSDEAESNPWMATEDSEEASREKKTSKLRRMIDVDRAINMLDSVDAPSKSEKGDQKATDAKTQSKTQNLTSMSQDELVRQAFAVDESQAEQEFQFEKEKIREEEDNPTRKNSAKEAAAKEAKGWGSWAGAGAPPPPKKKRKLPKKLQAPELKARARQDDKKPNVIVRERRMKQLSNTHMLQQIPYPYTSREEYERAMAGGIGTEWNVSSSFKQMTRPEIQTQAGKVIAPIAATAKKRRFRPAAKF